MNCNKELHDELKESGDIVCPFCDQKLEDSNEKPQDRLVKYYSCCDNQYIINDDGMLACLSCGVVQGYYYVKEYVNFYENRHRFVRKSVYHREYHINNILLDIEEKYNIKISNCQKHKIDAIYVEIGKVLNEVNGTRKRMISVNFIMRKIFKMMGIPYRNIPISKSKKTLAFYNRYWVSIMSLIGDKIKSIVE